MASDINLLPEMERDAKGKKTKPVVIEMTMPEGYVAPKKKTGGVLHFFKSVFRKPKPELPEPPRPAHPAPSTPTRPAGAPKRELRFSRREASTSTPDHTPAERDALLREIAQESGGRPASFPHVQPGPLPRQSNPVVPPATTPQSTAHIPAQMPRMPRESGKTVQTAPKKDIRFSRTSTSSTSSGPGIWTRFTLWLRSLFAQRTVKSAQSMKSEQPLKPAPAPLPTPPPPPAITSTVSQPAVMSTATPTPTPLPPQPSVPPPPPPKPQALPVTPTPPPVEDPKAGKVEPVAELAKPAGETVSLGYTEAPVLEPNRIRDVNLVPSELLDQTQPRKRIRTVMISGAASLAIVILAYIGLVVYQRAVIGETESIEKEIASVRTTIDTFADFRRESESVRRHVDDLSLLLDRHIHWEKFFTTLESTTIPEVYYTSVNVSSNGTVSLNAVGATTDAVSRQFTLFQKTADFATNVSISSISPLLDAVTQRPSGYGFTFSFTVSPSLFVEKR